MNEEQYNEALRTIAQDMAEVIDIDNEQAVEEYLSILNKQILFELIEQATEQATA